MFDEGIYCTRQEFDCTPLAVNHAGISYVPPNSSYAVALLVDLDWPRIAVIGAAVVALALAAALLPAWRAARRDIVEALAFA